MIDQSNESVDISVLDDLVLFNKLPIQINNSFQSISEQNSKENVYYSYICGKMYSHSATRYSFPVCDIYLFIPSKNVLYSSNMKKSEDCFNNSFKWTLNYFKRIRNYLTSFGQDNKNKYYFYINELSVNEGDELEKTEEKYFEIHLQMNGENNTIFRLLLKNIVEPQPFQFIINKSLELEKEQQEIINERQSRYNTKKEEIEKTLKDIQDAENNFIQKRKEIMVKGYLLLKEKDKKIKEFTISNNNSINEDNYESESST